MMGRWYYIVVVLAVAAAVAIQKGRLLWNGGRSIPLGTFWRQPGFTLGDMPDLFGKIALVTGANTGIGYETAMQLAHANATVLLACRDMAKCDAAAASVSAALKQFGSRGGAKAFRIDLADLHQIASAADVLVDDLPALDILVNNAGVATQFPHRLTKDDVEATFQINYLGHFLLTTRLLPALKRAPNGARIVHLSSGAHRGAPAEGVPLSREALNSPTAVGAYGRYGMAKLASLVFAKESDRRWFDKSGIISNAVHPGVVATELLRIENFEAMLGGMLGPVAFNAARLRNKFFAFTPLDAALSILYCAASPKIKSVPVRGELIVPVATPWPAHHTKADDVAFGAALWAFSEQLVREALSAPAKQS